MISAEIVLVTPDLARHMLALNEHNRAPKSTAIAKYADDMKHGRWSLTGEALKFSRSGALLDGQNRLMACLQANVPFSTFVIRGLDDDAQVAMDAGVQRRLQDVLKLASEVSVNQLAASLALHYRWATGSLLNKHAGPSLTRLAAREYLARHPEMRDAVRRAWVTKPAPVKARMSVMGAFAYEAARVSVGACEDFLHKVASGAGLDEHDPCWRLREWYITLGSKHVNLGRASAEMCLAMTIKAWNAYLAGAKVKILRWRPSVEPFPVMLGSDIGVAA